MQHAAPSTVNQWQRPIFAAVLCCALVTAGGAVTSHSTQAETGADSDGRKLLFGIAGCTREVILDKELTCLIKLSEVNTKKEYPLRFAVRTRPGAELILEDKQAGFWPLRGVRLSEPGLTSELGDGLLTAKVPVGTATVTLSARERKSGSELGQITVHLGWEPVDAFDHKVSIGTKYETLSDRQELLGSLERELERTQEPGARATLLVHIANLRAAYWKADKKLNPAISAAQTQEVRRVLEDALALTEKLRRVQSSARILSLLAFMAYGDPAERTKLIPKLEQAAARLTVLPGEQSGLYVSRAELLRRNNDLRAAHSQFEAAVAAAKWIGDKESVRAKQSRLLRVLFSEGLDIEQALKDEEAAARQQKSCDKAHRLQDLGWMRLLMWEQAPPKVSTAKPQEDPAAAALLRLFDEVFTLSNGKSAACQDARRAQFAISSKARFLSLLAPPASGAAQLGAWAAQVRRTVEDARALSGNDEVRSEVELDLQFALARLELAQNHVEKAAEHFDKLAELTRGTAEIEDRWEAACGAAATQALLEQSAPLPRRDRVAQKGQLLAECSELLDNLVGRVGLANQSRAMEPRDRRFGRLLSLLLLHDNQALLPVALQTMRRASRRATAPYRWPLVDDAMPSAEVTRLLDAYHKARADFEGEMKRTWPQQEAPGHDQPADRQGRVDKRRRALELVDQTYVSLHEQPQLGSAWRKLPEVPPDELLLICHSDELPEETSISCITALGSELRSARLAPKKMSHAEMAEKLLGPWRSKLPAPGGRAPAPIRRLRVIAHGWLREQQLVDWPFDDQLLNDRLPVVYSLDIVPVPTSAGQPSREAVFTIHPTGHIDSGADAVLQMLHGHLQLLNPKPRYFSVDTARFAAAPVAKDPHYERLYPVHNQASLFAALGHFKPGLCSRDPSPLGPHAVESPWLTSLCLSEHTSLWSADVLLAPQVPRIALLLGCSSGKQEERLSASSVSMASAYVLRGSQAVLGTVRDIQQPLAQQTLCHLTSDPLFNTPQFDLAAAVQRAQKAIRSHTPCPGGVDPRELASSEGDWTALRVYVP